MELVSVHEYIILYQ